MMMMAYAISISHWTTNEDRVYIEAFLCVTTRLPFPVGLFLSFFP